MFACGVVAGTLLYGQVCSGFLLTFLLMSIRKTAFLFPALFFAGMSAGASGMEYLSSGLSGSSDFFLTGSREHLQSVIEAIPFDDSRANGLLIALLTAERSSLSPEVTSAFRSSGASHILALSGMHIGIIYTMLDKVLIPLGNRPAARTVRAFLIIFVSAVFTFMTGASPSLVRALLFISLKEISGLSCRKVAPTDILFGALTIQLAISPQNIAMPGFQMSYLAMIGILFLYPLIRGLWPSSRMSPMKVLWDSASLSLSCQIFTGPVAWFHFHTFPKYFLITNLLAMPLTTILMFTALPAVLLSSVGICPLLLLKACSLSCTILINSLELISSLS